MTFLTLGSERARLQKRFAVVDAAPVHVLTRFDIVQGVGDAVEGFEEVVVVDILRLGADEVVVSRYTRRCGKKMVGKNEAIAMTLCFRTACFSI